MQVVDLHETIEGCLRGNQADWRALFDGHAAVVFHVLRGLGATPEMAEDTVGDVFLRLIEDRGECLSRARFADERQFRRWLIVLAKHHFLDVCRHERAARAVEIDETAEYELAASTALHDPAEELLDCIESRLEVERVLTMVTPREQLLLRLFYFDELRIREIADLTGSPVGAVSGAITRARDKIRQGVQQNEAVSRSMDGGGVSSEGANSAH